MLISDTKQTANHVINTDHIVSIDTYMESQINFKMTNGIVGWKYASKQERDKFLKKYWMNVKR